LPRSDYTYVLSPYEEISEEKYNEMVQKLPRIDFSQILTYEKEDQTTGAKELACVAGVCEIEEVAPITSQTP
jgi:ribonucleoside-diphosphate reductase alpha chain